MLTRVSTAFRSHRLFTAILIGYVALAVGFSVANPIYESTDELHHFRYIRYLQQYGALPEQRFDQPRIQAHHPPLYYVIAALATSWITPDRDALYEPAPNPYTGYRYWEINNDNKNRYLHGPDEAWPYHGVVLMAHVARWVNVLLGAIMVWVAYRLSLAVFPDRKLLAASATAIVAFNPQFLFMSGAINNDVIAGLFGSILLWQGVTIIRGGLTTRRSIFLALAFGLALMAKFNLAFALPLVELALLIGAWPQRDWRGFMKANVILLIGIAIFAGWWFVRNDQLYDEPTGVQRMNELWGGRDPRESFWLAVSEIPYAWSSLWGRFGYGQIPLPDAIYTGALIVTLIGLAGLIVAFVRSFRMRHREERPERSVAESKDVTTRSPAMLMAIASHPSTSQQKDAASLGTHAMTEQEALLFDRIQLKQLALVIFAALLFAAALFGYMMSSTAGPMGRFYFPGLSAFGLLLALGWRQITHYAPRFTHYAVPVASFALALIAFFGYFVPAYAMPGSIDATRFGPGPVFDGKIEFLGAKVDRVEAQPGDPIKVTLYWRALAPLDQIYTEFVHLIDGESIIVAQRDTWPGRGLYPTTAWQPGQAFADELTLHVPDGAYAPNTAMLQVGWVDASGARLDLVGPQGQAFATNTHPLGEVALLPRAGDHPNAMRVNFGGKVDLIGYEMSLRSILPGEAVTVTLYWQSRTDFDADYAVFLNAIRPKGAKSSEDTGRPLRGNFSTQQWPVGQIIADVRVLRFPPTAKPGLLDIEVGWFLPGTGRLSVLADDGHVLDDKQLLSKMRIRDK